MILICTTVLVLIFNVNTITDAGLSKNFQIFTNYEEVEKRIIQYDEWKDTVRGKVSRLRSKDICYKSRDIRIDFCEKALHVREYGFKFDLDNYPYLACKQQDFWTSMISFKTHFQTDMFTCPQIVYMNLETKKETLLPYVFTASRGKSSHSAFTFVHEKTSNIKRPFQYIEKIEFQKQVQGNELYSFTLPALKMYKQPFATTPLEKLLGLRLSGKNKVKIYEKFLSKFSSMNICGLRRKHKIFICRQRLEFKHALLRKYLLPLEGYDGKCRRRSINIRAKNALDSNKMLSVVLCPPVITFDGILLTTIDSYQYYISSSIFSFSVTLFRRLINGKGGKLQPLKSYNHQIDNVLIERDIQRDRFLPYPSEEERKNGALHKSIEDILSEMNLQQPIPISNVESVGEAYGYKKKQSSDPKSLKIFQAAWLADDLAISFSRIKKSTRVYTRFMETYKTIDLVKLSAIGRQKLCNHVSVLVDITYGREENHVSRFMADVYHRLQVVLTVRDRENLLTGTFSMRECQCTTDSSQYKFFVGKTLLNNVAVLYRSSFDAKDVVEEVYPHGVIINMDQLE